MSTVYTTYQHQSKNFQPERLKNYKLCVIITQEVLVYAILNHEEKILALKEYRNQSDQMEVEEFFDAVREQDYFLKEDFNEVRILAGHPEFSLVPGRYFKPELAKSYGAATLREEFDLHHLSYRPLGHGDAMAVFAIPFPLKRKCDHYFDSPEYIPWCNPAVQMGIRLSEGNGNLVLVNVMESNIVLTAIKGGRLMLCNSYPFESPTDIVYFIQLAEDVMKLEGQPCKVFVTGNFEPDSELLRQLRQFVPDLVIPGEELQQRFDTLSDKLPTWKYALMTF